MVACRRPLFCPICGQRVMVDVPDTTLPEVHVIPDHHPGEYGNLCAGYVVEVTLRLDICSECGCKMCKHPSGLCMQCYSKKPLEAK